MAANAAWSKTTNAAAVACTTLRKAAAGIDMGLARDTANPNQYVLKINVPDDSYMEENCTSNLTCQRGDQCRNGICVSTGAFYMPNQNALYTRPMARGSTPRRLSMR